MKPPSSSYQEEPPGSDVPSITVDPERYKQAAAALEEAFSRRPDLGLLRQIYLFGKNLKSSGEVADVISNLTQAIDLPDIYTPHVKIEVAAGDAVKASVTTEPHGTGTHYAIQITGAYPQRLWFSEETADTITQALYIQITYQIAQLRSKPSDKTKQTTNVTTQR